MKEWSQIMAFAKEETHIIDQEKTIIYARSARCQHLYAYIVGNSFLQTRIIGPVIYHDNLTSDGTDIVRCWKVIWKIH